MKMRHTSFVIALVLLALAGTEVLAQSAKFGLAVNGYGRVRVFGGTDSLQQFDRFSILAGVGAGKVFDYWNDSEIVEDVTTPTPTVSDLEYYSVFNNTYSALPPKFTGKLRTYQWFGNKYAIGKYELVNDSSVAYTTSIGFEFIPKVNNTYGLETVDYNAAKGVVYTYKTGETYSGVKILNTQTTGVVSFDWYEGYNLSDDSLWMWLNKKTFTNTFTAGTDGATTILNSETFTIPAGGSKTIYVAYAADATLNGFLAQIDSAVARYNRVWAVSIDKTSDLVPGTFAVEQNYPNPFNPSTIINFSVPSQEFVSVRVFNLLGEEVSTLVNNELTAGNYSVTFNAEGLQSGVYFYSVSVGSNNITKKMMLTK